MSNTKIPWCDKRWNVVTGCTPISKGCDNCYAKRMAYRMQGRFGYPKNEPFSVTFHPNRLPLPLKWKKPKKIFVNSMGDLFHKDVQFHWLLRILEIIKNCPQHTFIILTKRPKKMKKQLETLYSFLMSIDENIQIFPNLWLGVTCENQKAADEQIPILLDIPTNVKFVSCEPLLEKVDLHKPYGQGVGKLLIDYLDWVICGAETGKGARYMDPYWAFDLQQQCQEANVPFFMKQFSKITPIISPNKLIREFPK